MCSRVFTPPNTKAVDYVFSKRKTYWVIIALKNGEKIAGMYGPSSFASSAPAEEQIYLEEHWLLNDDEGFERPANQTSGIIILTSEILDMAINLGVSRKTLSKIINTRGSITPEMALRLSRAFDTAPDLWLNLQKILIYGLLKKNQRLGE